MAGSSTLVCVCGRVLRHALHTQLKSVALEDGMVGDVEVVVSLKDEPLLLPRNFPRRD